MTRMHWDPYTAYDADGYERRLQHPVDEPRHGRRFGYQGPAPADEDPYFEPVLDDDRGDDGRDIFGSVA